ncbi:exodeoxyribonuclease III [Candidatus Saccharibacteria bacterium]|nr:exodeoxyribonuclease III [Candidatus Saccharibacteria bacterium]
MLRIFSWNVNGLRAVLNKKALQKLIEEQKPDILCLQEIKAKPKQVNYKFPGYKVFWNPAKRAGYSGTAILFSEDCQSRFVCPKMYIPDDAEKVVPKGQSFPDVQRMTFLANKSSEENNIAVPEGRVLGLDCEKFYLVNVYVPNSKPDLSRLELREKEWDPEFLQFLKELEKTKPVVVCGDFNVAHEEIDIARPKTNHHSAGFTDEERQGMTNYLNAGLIDTFRTLHPKAVRYTWWSHWGKARENNVGWRIDYFLISKGLRKNLKSAEIYENYMGSDHCPISIDLEI